MKRLAALTAAVLLRLIQTVMVSAADYDLVINNGRVMDPETNYDAVANVGIASGKIAVITKDKIEVNI